MNSPNFSSSDPTYFTHLRDLHEAYIHRLNPRVIGKMFADPNEQTYEFNLGIGGVFDFQIFINALEKRKIKSCSGKNPRRIEFSLRVNTALSDSVEVALN
jgi:hypothetical protein